MDTFAHKLASRSEGLRQPHRNSIMMAATMAAISRGEVNPSDLQSIDAELTQLRVISSGDFYKGMQKIVNRIPHSDPDAVPRIENEKQEAD